MDKTLIIGHKSPDTDSICSVLAMTDLEKKLGNEVEACCLGNINNETKHVLDYLKIESPRLIDNIEDGQNVILVDHNESTQSVDNLENANILKVIDHHAINIKVSYPLYYIAEPVGCTATVIYGLYKQNNIEIGKSIAVLLLSAIISDTLLFKSPTCTKKDIEIANVLSMIADININEYGLAMLKAGTDLSSFSAEQLINIDSKEFMVKDLKLVIAQVNTVDIRDVLKKQEELEIAIQNEINKRGISMFLFAITDILECNSEILVLGDKSDIASKAFNVDLSNNRTFLPGVVSRKKQMIPVITQNI